MKGHIDVHLSDIQVIFQRFKLISHVSLAGSLVLTLLSSCSSQLSLNAVRKGSSLESAIREGLDSAL